MPPTTTLWPLERHTEAKHRILKRYLQAWLPIVANVRGDEMWLVDGFAGPGEYDKGESGSPIHMLDAYVTHKARSGMDGHKRLRFVFIERRLDRFQHLEAQVGAYGDRLSPATVEVQHGDFGALMPAVNAKIEAAGPAPSFLFVDPFGYEETDPQLTTRILQMPHCETLTFLPIEHIARFVQQDALAPTLDRLFRGGSWRGATSLVGTAARIESIRQSYVAMLHEDAAFVRSFSIRSESEFALFFASNHELGLAKMKEAMWSVDPVGGTTFADSTSPGQEVLFADAGLSGAIESIIRGLPTWTSIKAIERMLIDTPYLPKHLRTEIVRLHGAGRIQVLPTSELSRLQPGTLVIHT
jgi:three-Cys-motif partner protein